MKPNSFFLKVCLALCFFVFDNCGSDQSDSQGTVGSIPSKNSSTTTWWKPVAGTTWQIQFTGELDTSVNAQVYTIDLFDTDSATITSLQNAGRKVVCYTNFGSYEDFRPDAGKFPPQVLGNSNGMVDERWLDIRNLSALAPIMRARLDLAVEKGCDGIIADNVDGYMHDTGFPLTDNDQLTYNTWVAQEAHNRGLGAGLVNNLLQLADLVDDYDYLVNESCYTLGECLYLNSFIKANKPVFGIEYELAPSAFCPLANAAGYSFLQKNLNLDAFSVQCSSFKP